MSELKEQQGRIKILLSSSPTISGTLACVCVCEFTGLLYLFPKTSSLTMVLDLVASKLETDLNLVPT